MSRPTTSNYGLQKSLQSDPERNCGVQEEHWGAVMDGNLDAIDSAIAASGPAADRVPASPTAWDDEFAGNSLDSKWSWTNQGDAAAAVGNGVLKLSARSDSLQWTLLLQNAPVGNWTIAARIGMQGNITNFATVGLCVLDSATGHRYNFGVFAKADGTTNQYGGGMEVQSWADISTYNADDYACRTLLPYYPLYYKIAKDATNLTFSYSLNGAVYTVVSIQPLASFVANPNKFGLSIWSLQGLSNNSFDLVCDWFRRLA